VLVCSLQLRLFFRGNRIIEAQLSEGRLNTQEGIGHKPAGQSKGKQRDGKWRRDKNAYGAE
jgi:hypothetical protein